MTEKYKSQKRIYLTLLLIIVILITTISATIKHLFTFHDHWTHIIMIPLITIAHYLLLALVVAGISVMLLNLLKIGFYRNIVILTSKLNRLIFPLILALGSLVGFSEEEVKRSYIEVNNQMIINRNVKYKPQDVLLLAPHCLQNSLCGRKITLNSDNCLGCGKCQVKDLLRIRDKYGINLTIVSGGTSAKRSIKKIMPRVVIAVACERDLVSGIQETGKLPVYGVLNSRPNGPCHDTFLSIKHIEKALSIVIQDSSVLVKAQVVYLKNN